VRIAQTNIQLFNQLRDAGRTLDELAGVHRAYELLTTLYSSQTDGDREAWRPRATNLRARHLDVRRSRRQAEADEVALPTLSVGEQGAVAVRMLARERVDQSVPAASPDPARDEAVG
jgi:hypothetical protein